MAERPERPARVNEAALPPTAMRNSRPARPAGRRGRASPARIGAVRALLDVEEGRNAEDAAGSHAPVDPADRALCWNLVFGVLRTRSALDAGIVAAARRAVWTLDPPVLAVLRVGLYEKGFMRTPPHAVVDQAVEVSRAVGAGHASSFVNALMRRAEPVMQGPASLGYPEWLVSRWGARLGARAEAWMRGANEPAPVHIVAKEDPAGVSLRFQKAGIAIVPVGEGVFRLPSRSGRIDELPGFLEGQWWVMDPAAVAVADLVPEVSEVLDVCAAPGGKSLRLAARGMRVTATDLDATRLERVRENSARVGLPLTVLAHDWEAGALPGQWPAVLVDAPCTALGLVRRHPELRWRREEADIQAAAIRQKRILAHAAKAVAPGGWLVYAVCSPEREEGPEVAATLRWPIEATWENVGNPDGADAFWGCRLRRPAEAGANPEVSP